MKYNETMRVPCPPNARQTRRAKRNALEYPDKERPANITGAPATKITVVAIAADSQVGGNDVNAHFTLSTMPAKMRSRMA